MNIIGMTTQKMIAAINQKRSVELKTGYLRMDLPIYDKVTHTNTPLSRSLYSA